MTLFENWKSGPASDSREFNRAPNTRCICIIRPTTIKPNVLPNRLSDASPPKITGGKFNLAYFCDDFAKNKSNFFLVLKNM
jgi:hypothetical protein